MCRVVLPVTSLISALLAGLSVLLLKRLRESPQRESMIWAFDVSKQFLAQTAGFVLLALYVLSTAEENGICEQSLLWFSWLRIVICVVATPMGLGLLHLLTRLARWRGFKKLCNSGVYADFAHEPPRLSWWGMQSFTWFAITLLCRILIIITLSELEISSTITNFFSSFDSIYSLMPIIFVVVCVCTNAAELWIQDTYLMENRQSRMRRQSSARSMEIAIAPRSSPLNNGADISFGPSGPGAASPPENDSASEEPHYSNPRVPSRLLKFTMKNSKAHTKSRTESTDTNDQTATENGPTKENSKLTKGIQRSDDRSI